MNPEEHTPGDFYRFMISVIIPRPIAFISTIGANESLNVAPFSYFCPITNKPPLIGVSINSRRGEPKDTLRNIREMGEFVVNIVTEDLLSRMVQTSGEWPADVDEFQLAGLTPVPSERVKPPRVAESPVNLECRLFQEVPLGETTLVIGEILRGHVDESVVTDGRVDALKLQPVGRLGGDGYSIVREIVHFARPKVNT
jgi:flavin reductase (DIM6/NTAB) family NADH-FMN oxidoreductase RutF